MTAARKRTPRKATLAELGQRLLDAIGAVHDSDADIDACVDRNATLAQCEASARRNDRAMVAEKHARSAYLKARGVRS